MHRGLLLEHVETRSGDPAVAQRLDEGGLVDHGPP